MKHPFSIRRRMHLLIIIVTILMLLIASAVLMLLFSYNSLYSRVLYNVTTASEFNRDFKNIIDQKMYYYVIESQYSEGLPISEVASAKELARDLISSTTRKDSLQAITSVLDLCENLEDKIYLIYDTRDYDERLVQLENNIYVLTALIQEYMYNYLYCEAVALNALQQQIARETLTEIIVVVILTVSLLIFATRYALSLSRSITEPIVELCSRAEDISGGDLTARDPISTDTHEIRILSEGMEQMVSRLNAQMADVRQKQEHLRRTELALLQAQINPHFLYNTMDTIIWLIEAERSADAVEMVSNLSSFFRHSLSRGEDVITLREEERHVLSYLQIQHVRYKDILSYTIAIDPALGSAVIPKLTLQPLVENALYHGIKLKRRGGHILIDGRREGDDIILRVTDDGVGISAERLAHLRRSMESDERVGFGVSAVNQRLRLFFGPGYGLSLDGEEGVGATVTVRIPYQEKEALSP